MTNPRELVERLLELAGDDHERLSCNARYAECSCGYTARMEAAVLEAASEITRLRGLLEAWEGLAGRDRINLVGKNGDSLDEIVLTGMAHLEKMTSGSWYLGLYHPDGSGYQVWLSAAKGPMRADYAELDAREEPEKQDATSTPSGQ